MLAAELWYVVVDTHGLSSGMDGMDTHGRKNEGRKTCHGQVLVGRVGEEGWPHSVAAACFDHLGVYG